ncbi:MAG TPA: glycosyltransferase family 9 protein, partial [Chitinivibrionales bacterium]
MKTILVTPLIGMGDTLMTTPALRLLKTRLPDVKLTYLTIGHSNFELLKGNPFIDTLLYYPLKSAGIFNGPAYILNNFFRKFSISLTFYPANRAAYNLFALLTASPKRIGHTYLHANITQLNWLKNQTIPEEFSVHCGEETVRLLKFLGITADNGNIAPMEIFLTPQEKALAGEVKKTAGNRTIIGVHAGTSTFKNQNRRRWSQEKFAELIDRFPGCHFVLFGTKEEEDVNKAIQAGVKNGGGVSLIGNRPLREAIALIG